ncbi:alcohol dehydrogenase catalytic domain-containing protein [Actinokineospora bangkokensis]|uniref:Alcohol dehydrogenase n=1 Tax=Actinokineospora bangkokensis TaxID=1193682 RepID=A0A1Q9LR07_9PSEU|nr:alcohol dehydrogenase catalytic domain-containing protein [Actinokineospora bangkokensis]OLR94476.1 alcohol dehydrogenase [Actinokineospora bangkokensis]
MRALRYEGPGRPVWTVTSDPAPLVPTDAVVAVDAVTLCGTDLHILRGDVPEVVAGTILGHEAVGTVEAVGSAVASVRPGDRVLVSCISACGRCRSCLSGRQGLCTGGGGWVLGHRINGTQAEYVRTPFADTSLHLLPEKLSDEDALVLCDILPTAYEVGVLNGQVRPGDVVVVVGAGPVGIAAVRAAAMFTPRAMVVVDPAPGRRQMALAAGAQVALDGVDDPGAAVSELTGGRGADVVIEAVGVPEAFELCVRLVRPGGHVANVGVHGAPAALHLEAIWDRDLTVTTGLVDTRTTPELITMVAEGLLPVDGMITHSFDLNDIESAYDVFTRAGETGALKVALHRKHA